MFDFSSYIVPMMLFLILCVSVLRGKNPFNAFVSGAKSALCDVCNIFPSLLALVVMTELLSQSGLLDALGLFLSPVLSFFHIPRELCQLFIISPISGSGATAALQRILSVCTPDSFSGRAASVICAGTETTFYVSAIYFCGTRVKKMRYSIICALIGDFVCVAAGCYFCRLLF